MDLYSEDVKKIQSLLQEWITKPKQEIEATFGIGGVVDSSTFLQIAQRLRMKGFEPLPQDDRLSILTPNQIRMSLQGIGILQKYCKEDSLENTPFSAMIKDRTYGGNSMDISNIDLKEYNVRIKSRREEPLAQDDPRVREILENWPLQKKAFRLIRRWTFRGKGLRIDMSMVRSSPKVTINTAKGVRQEYQYTRTFLESNVFQQVPSYEVEVEIEHDEHTDTVEKAMKVLIGGIGEVLRAIQKNTLLIRNSTAEKAKQGYRALTNLTGFRGVNLVNMEVANMTQEIIEDIPNIRTGYNVTDKADGLRAMGFVDKSGELFLIDKNINVYKTGLKNPKCAESLVDGEWVTSTKDEEPLNHYLIFDIYYTSGARDVSTKLFADVANIDGSDSRYNDMRKWYDTWKEGTQTISKGININNKLIVALKKYEFAAAGDRAIFTACDRMLDTKRIYYTDGLILSPNSKPLPQPPEDTWFDQFKWKPAIDNSIDFLVKFERDTTYDIDKVTVGIHPGSGETIRYKTLRLFVGSARIAALENPREAILFNQVLPAKQQKSRKYKPVLFTPDEYPDTMASVCNVTVQLDPETGEEYVITEDSSEPIRDNSVVEMRYDHARDAGWRWIPMRVRHDKSEQLLKTAASKTGVNYLGTLNGEKTANRVWNSINNPVTESMIRTGDEEPTEAELRAILKVRETDVAKKYYERKAAEEDLALVRGMVDFHNKYIKNTILYSKLLRGGGKSVLDLACGRAGDLFKWIFNRARLVIGVDTAGDNITASQGGAYRRYMDAITKFGRNRVPPIAFMIGNSSRSLINGEAGATPEERDMLRSIFGKYEPEGPVPPYIEQTVAGSMRAGADVAVCMFALHYFFENMDTLDGFIKNIRDTVKPGGYFAGCAFDGNKVFDLLRSVEIGHSKTGKEGDTPIWTITKQYDTEELTPDESSIGLAIDVEFISIGTTHREYLIPFKYFEKRMRDIGFEYLNDTELSELGLVQSTSTFDVSYEMAQKGMKGGKKTFIMTDSVKTFSFLNRWFIFKRRSEIGVPETIQEIEEETMGDDAINLNKSIAHEPNTTINNSTAMAKATIAEEEEKVIEAPTKPLIPNSDAKLPSSDKKFTDIEIFRFGADAILQDRLKIKDIGAARFVGLTGRFPIPDQDDASITYPTMEHFLAAMKLKYASNNPKLGKDLMSTKGSIHQQYELKRRAEGIELEKQRDYDMLAAEIKDVRSKMTKTSLNQYKATVDDSKWVPIKDKMLQYALEYRWNNDARFHRIVEAAREQGKYMLYTMASGSGAAELSGVRKADGRIEGENKVGKMIMELAGFRF